MMMMPVDVDEIDYWWMMGVGDEVGVDETQQQEWDEIGSWPALHDMHGLIGEGLRWMRTESKDEREREHEHEQEQEQESVLDKSKRTWSSFLVAQHSTARAARLGLLFPWRWLWP
ncbi:hypothetical protein AK830_g11761 [Neonectria ditissima]|uniref:Uncharacterized protein n=1 Tax=Neonectria ditissima TaxID=78410 RepID=A0A0N8H504_9HYPO|nr:hypothetical protein AK830_g11761 [Neonectria ditissima]